MLKQGQFNMRSIFDFFKRSLLLESEVSLNIIKIFGLFSVINFPLFYLLPQYLNKGNYESLFLRSIAFILCLCITFVERWPNKLEKFIPLFWHLTVIYCLPFFGTYMFLENINSISWLTNISIGLVWLVLITNWITFILFLLIGVSLGAFAHYLVAGPTYLNMEVLGGAFVNYLWAAIIAAIFAQRKENIQNIKQKSLKMQAAAIAHEMRTPLSAVKHIVNGLKLHLPTLINTQQTAQEKDQNIPYISKNKLQSLEGMPTKLETIAGSASNVIDMLLMNLRENPPEAVLVKCSMLDCVEIALNAYSLTNQERNLISVERGEDFEIKANQDLLKHVFFNLLKNSLYYVKAAKKGKISIWTEKGQQVNKLHFKDTGKGISKESLPHIFNQFYSRTDHGTGVGLAFCKMVMQHLGGDITCDSVEGEFTQFTLTFPVLK